MSGLFYQNSTTPQLLISFIDSTAYTAFTCARWRIIRIYRWLSLITCWRHSSRPTFPLPIRFTADAATSNSERVYCVRCAYSFVVWSNRIDCSLYDFSVTYSAPYLMAYNLSSFLYQIDKEVEVAVLSARTWKELKTLYSNFSSGNKYSKQFTSAILHRPDSNAGFVLETHDYKDVISNELAAVCYLTL